MANETNPYDPLQLAEPYSPSEDERSLISAQEKPQWYSSPEYSRFGPDSKLDSIVNLSAIGSLRSRGSLEQNGMSASELNEHQDRDLIGGSPASGRDPFAASDPISSNDLPQSNDRAFEIHGIPERVFEEEIGQEDLNSIPSPIRVIFPSPSLSDILPQQRVHSIIPDQVAEAFLTMTSFRIFQILESCYVA